MPAYMTIDRKDLCKRWSRWAWFGRVSITEVIDDARNIASIIKEMFG